MLWKDSSESARLMPLERRVGRHSPSTLREQTAAAYARRQLSSLDLELRVIVLARKLFDLTVELHGLRSRDRRTLRLAALLHDVGRRFGEKNHPADGARMIAENLLLPLSARQRRAIAYLTRYHRGAVPRIGFDGILRRGDRRKPLMKILALLRAADALDNRQLQPPTLAIAIKGRKLSIICFVESDLNKARKVYRRRKKFRLLEELLDLKVEVDVERAHTVAHA
jgi:exopolyphosphatase/guanosine-5'-triphosphate,3'-diphosphate pyrophosphatase